MEQKDFLIEKLNQAISKINFYENPGISHSIEQKYLLEGRIRELEKENRVLNEEKKNHEVQNKIISEKMSDLKKKLDEHYFQQDLSKQKYNEEKSILESKVSKLKDQNDILTLQNNELKSKDEKYKLDILQLKNDKEKFEEKYNKHKSKKEEFTNQISILKNQLREVEIELLETINDKNRHEKQNWERNNAKKMCIESMKNGIFNLKKEFQNRSKSGIIRQQHPDINFNKDIDYCKEIDDFKRKKEITTSRPVSSLKQKLSTLSSELAISPKRSNENISQYKNNLADNILNTEPVQSNNINRVSKIQKINSIINKLSNISQVKNQINNIQMVQTSKSNNSISIPNSSNKQLHIQTRERFNQKLDDISRSLSRSSNNSKKNSPYNKYKEYTYVPIEYDMERENFRKDNITVHPNFKYAPNRSPSSSVEKNQISGVNKINHIHKQEKVIQQIKNSAFKSNDNEYSFY